MMRIVVVELRALPGKEEAVADFLQAHAARSCALEEDCLAFKIAIDPAKPGAFHAVEDYRTPEAHAAHRETDHFKRFAADCLPMCQDAPDGTKFFNRIILDRIG